MSVLPTIRPDQYDCSMLGHKAITCSTDSINRRTVLFRARDNAISEGSAQVEPHHILIALRDLHPEVLARLFSAQADAEAVSAGSPAKAVLFRRRLRSRQGTVREPNKASVAERDRRRSSLLATVGTAPKKGWPNFAGRRGLLGVSLESANPSFAAPRMVRAMDSAKKVGGR